MASFVTVAVLFALLACPSNVFGQANPEGYIVTAEFWCDDFLCPDWELDIARQTTLFNVHEITNLSALIPKSPIAEMSFPVLTALDNTSRIFYVFGMPDQGAAHIWVAQLDANVSKADVAPVVVWTFSDPSMTLVRVHVGAKGVVYGVFQTGEVVIVDTTKGQATLFANLVTNDPDLKDAVVTSASTIDAVNNRLFAVLLSPTYGWAHFATLNLVAKTQTNWNISIKGDYVYLESFFNALWVPSENKVLLFLTGNWDQLIWIDQANGTTTTMIRDLSQYMMAFTVDYNTKAVDTYQVDCYDARRNRIYFQTTSYDSDDDLGTTSIAYIDLSSRERLPSIAVSPSNFGFMGFHYVNVL